MFARWCNFLLGLWLVVAPAIFSYAALAPRRVDVWTGIAVAFITVLAAAVPRLRLFSAAVGLWLVAAPFIFHYADHRAALRNDVFVGFAIVAFSLIPVGPRHTFEDTAEQPRGV